MNEEGLWWVSEFLRPEAWCASLTPHRFSNELVNVLLCLIDVLKCLFHIRKDVLRLLLVLQKPVGFLEDSYLGNLEVKQLLRGD